jgi:DNA anti-recombination protein RmuC
MAVRSSVLQLPPEVKEWLDQNLIESNFSGYQALSEALEEKGYSVSKSSIHRYGKGFESSLAAVKLATEQAKAIVESSPDNEGAMNEALIRLVQQKSFEVLTKLESDDNKALTNIGHMVSSLAKSSVTVKKHAAEIRAKVEEKFNSLEEASKMGKDGLHQETLRRIREEIYGIIT